MSPALASPSSKGVLLVHAAKMTVVCFYLSKFYHFYAQEVLESKTKAGVTTLLVFPYLSCGNVNMCGVIMP
jgi:hypothetical protein